MSATCITGHAHIVATGSCLACHQPVQFSGPLSGIGTGELTWRVPPFSLPAARCRITGSGHQVGTAAAVCLICCARLYGLGTESGASWIEIPTVTVDAGPLERSP